MGHHYVPQRYLRQFEVHSGPGLIWQYAKDGGPPKCVPIKVAAQSRGYYEPEVEGHLASDVEPQGSEAIEKLLQGEVLEPEERLALALYLGVMMKRVPAHRRRVNEMMPGVLTEVMANFRETVRELFQADQERLAKLLADAAQVERKYEDEPPQNVKDLIREPYPSELILGAIITMHWRVFVADGHQSFITSDNPFFFTRGCGLGNHQSEFFLPLSPSHLLHGCRSNPNRGVPTCKMRQAVVRQVNKRTAFEAENLVFSHEQPAWLPKIIAIKELNEWLPEWQIKCITN